MIDTWVDVFRTSFNNIWVGTADFIPKFLVALIVLIAGLILGGLVQKIIEQVFSSVKVDSILRNTKIDEALVKAGFVLDSGRFVGALVKWFVIAVFLVASFDILGLTQVNLFLQQVVLGYLPRVIVAVLILIIAAIIAEAMQKLVSGASRAAGVTASNFVGTASKWAIWIFAVLMALYQLGIALALIQTLFTGFVVAIALALGLSFGLGGQQAASDFIEKMKREISDKRQK